jgi:hypothetical protein
MTAQEENKLSRNFKVTGFFKKHLATLAPHAPSLQAHVDNFNLKVDEAIDYVQKANEDRTGAKLAKTYVKKQLCGLTIGIAGIIRAHYVANNDNFSAQKFKITKSEIMYGAEAEALIKCQKILAEANAIEPAILAMGVTPAQLLAFSNGVQDFSDNIYGPKEDIEEGANATKLFRKTLKECDEIIERLKDLMLIHEGQFRNIYSQFLSCLKIDNNRGGRPKKANLFELDLPSGLLRLVFNLPYKKSKLLTLTNHSEASILFGLSNFTDNFSNPPLTLKGKETLSLSLEEIAPSGDLLLVKNESEDLVSLSIVLK